MQSYHEKDYNKNMQRPTTTIFSRLLFYFVVVMLIPLLILIVFYFYYSENNVHRIIENQTETAIDKDIRNLYDIFNSYRHIVSVLAEDTEIIEVLESDTLSNESLKDIYSLLFSHIGGDNTKAQISIISKSGKIQISTHTFPETYDLRIYSNQWDSSNILAQAIATENLNNKNEVYTSISDHRTTFTGKIVLASLLKNVMNNEGNILGYIIVDIYSEAITPSINTSSIFQEEILLDNTNYLAISLLQPSIYGSFNTFPNIRGEDLITIEKQIPDTDFSIIASTDVKPYMNNISSSMFFLAISILIGFVISVCLSLLFSHSFAKRAKMLTDTMEKIEEGKLDVMSNQQTGLVEFDKLAEAFNNMTIQISRLIDLTREEEAKLAEAERKELEDQLNPHFLFNTLNTIKALARLHGEEEIYTISVRLGKILRSTLRNRDSECTIRESLDLVESYLMIQKIRFKDKISYTIEADPSLMEEMTPKLIIQPLVENAIIHGLEPMTTPGHLFIRVMDLDSRIFISVIDDGVGFNPVDIHKMSKEGHVGLYNVYRRLELKYGEELSFSIDSTPEKGCSIKISFPYNKNEARK